MARPRRTKVASKAPTSRVAESSPTIVKSKTAPHVGALDTKPKATRSRKSKAKPVEQPEENEHMMSGNLRRESSIGLEAQVSKRRRSTARNQPRNQPKPSAIELKRRRMEPRNAQKTQEPAPAVTESLAIPRTSEPPSASRSSPTHEVSPVAPSTLMMVNMSMAPERENTPPLYDPDEELYGLSPGGEISLARVQVQKASGISQPKITTAPPSALRVRSTPAAETSLLALANFKRRPRQPSIIRQLQLASETGERYDFTNLELEFEPEDESTPLHLHRRRTRSSLGSEHPKSAVPTSSSSRKRKFSEIQVPATQSSPALGSSPPPSLSRSRSPPAQGDESDLPAERAMPSTERDDARPTIYSDTMADPRSSSSISLPTMHDTLSGRHAKSRRIVNERHDTTIVSVTALNTRQAKAKSGANTMTTAALQSLLPKPRRKQRPAAAKANDAFEIPSSEGGDVEMRDLDEEDEPEPEPVPARRTRRATTARPRTTTITPARKHESGRLRKPTLSPVSARKFLAPKGQGRTRGISKPASKSVTKEKKTYGRRRDDEDKENDSDALMSDAHASDDDGAEERRRRARSRTKEISIVLKSREIESARAKFAEVDEWEMEFESVDLGGGNESGEWR